MNAGQYGDATAMWTEIIEAEPCWEHGSAFDSLAFCYEQSGEFEKARECYRRALEIEPENEIHQANWVSFLAHLGDPTEALQSGVNYLKSSVLDNDALLTKLLELAESHADKDWTAKILALRQR